MGPAPCIVHLGSCTFGHGVRLYTSTKGDEVTDSQKLELRASEIRQRLNEIAGLEGDALNDEVRGEADKLHTEYRDVETRRRAALVAEDEAEERAAQADGLVLDSETRERLELRKRVKVLDFFSAAMKGRVVSGAAAEYSDAEGAGGDIPMSLWEPDPREKRALEERVVTGAPSVVGINTAPIQPAVFAPSIAAMMGIDMPQVESGTFAQATITGSLTASARTKGSAQAATAATFTTKQSGVKSVSGVLEFLAEDVAAAGVGNFEASLRDNASMVLSAELDNQFINGNGTAPNITGLIKALGDATADSTLLTFAHGVSKLSALVEGLWSTEVSQVRQLVGVDTFRLAAKLVTSAATGEVTLAEYLKRVSAGFTTNSRMPNTASMKQSALVYRTGRSGMRTAVCPHWGRIGITDIYSGATKAQTAVSFHVLVGDVLVVQPDAYEHVEYKVA